MNQKRYLLGGGVIGHSKETFHMIVAGGCKGEKSAEIYSFQNDKWSPLPDLKYDGYANQLIVIDGMMIAGSDGGLFGKP